MTPREVINSFRDMYPNQFGDDTLTGWIAELEGCVISDVILTHEGAPDGASSFGGISHADADTYRLFAGAPHGRIYADYLRMMCDEARGDTARYRDSSEIFYSSFADFADAYNRAHMPLGVRELTV